MLASDKHKKVIRKKKKNLRTYIRIYEKNKKEKNKKKKNKKKKPQNLRT